MLWKKIISAVLGLLLVAVLILPVGALLYISQQEQAQYTSAQRQGIELEEFSYGAPSPVMLMDISEQIQLNGSVISTKILYEELDAQMASRLRLIISAGEVLLAGDVIGYCQGQAVYATQTGVIKSIHLGADAYIELWSLEDLAIECYVSAAQLKILKRGSLKLSDGDGNLYTVSHIDTISIGSDKTRVLLTSDTAGLIFGINMGNFTLNTGRVYTDSLVLLSKCIYSYDGGNTYYVRLVAEDGTVLEETQVTPGVTIGAYTCVDGLQEGQYCDSGYGSVVAG